MRINEVRNEDLLSCFTKEEIQSARYLFTEASQRVLQLQDKVPDFILNLEQYPLGRDTRSHLAHLLYIESQIPGRKLRILDLSCGGGDFTRIARSRGHKVFCTESDIARPDILPNDIRDMPSFRSYYRHKIREVNKVTPEHLYILPNSLQNLNLEENLDVIYLNQCSLHMPPQPGGIFWQEREWRGFLSACDRALKPDGMAFLNVADPSYLTLGAYLKRFFKNYFDVNATDHRFWTLFIVDKAVRSLIQTPLQDDELPDDPEYYRIVGEAATTMPNLLL